MISGRFFSELIAKGGEPSSVRVICEVRPHREAGAGLKFSVLLPQPPRCWHYRRVPLCLDCISERARKIFLVQSVGLVLCPGCWEACGCVLMFVSLNVKGSELITLDCALILIFKDFSEQLAFYSSCAFLKTVAMPSEGTRPRHSVMKTIVFLLLMPKARTQQGIKINHDPFTNQKWLSFGWVFLLS